MPAAATLSPVLTVLYASAAGGDPSRADIVALKEAGCAVHQANSATVALELMRSGRSQFDAVVTEYKLRARDGVWLLQGVDVENDPVRILIADSTVLDFSRLATDGVVDRCLMRPFSPRVLVEAVCAPRPTPTA